MTETSPYPARPRATATSQLERMADMITRILDDHTAERRAPRRRSTKVGLSPKNDANRFRDWASI